MDVRKFIFDNQAYFEDFISRSTYHTNAIEGNTLSYAETYAILFNDNDFKVSATPREIYEAINHKYAINHILSHLDEELSESLIKKAAVLINKNISEIAGYRTVAVRIKGAQHVPPAPNQVPQQMMYFVYNYNHTVYEDVFQKIEALTGHRKESVVERLSKYREQIQDNRKGDSEIRDKKLNEMRESER